MASLIGAMVLTVAAMVGVHYFQVKRQAGQLLVRAKSLADKQEWSASANLYKSYTKIRRDQPEVLADYAQVLEELRRTRADALLDCQKVYEELLVLEPDRVEAREKLVRVYLQMQQYSAAEANLKTLSTSKDASQNVELQMLWADWHQQFSKNYSAMADHLRQAVETGKARPVAYGRLARALKIDIKPNTPENEREAEAVIARLLKDYPDDIPARLVRADYRFFFHGPDAAREEVLYAYRNIPAGASSPEVAIALQRLAVSPEDRTQAQEALQKAIAANGEDARLRIALAEVLSRGSDPSSAIETLRAAIANAPPDIVLVEVSERLLSMGETQTVRLQADRLAIVPRMSAFAGYLRGRAALIDGNWPEAIEPLKRAIGGLQNQSQQLVQAHLALAECYRLGNQPEPRREELRNAEKLDPRSPRVKFLLAECLAELGQTKTAKELYTLVLPQLPAARLPLARLQLAEQVLRPEAERRWVDLEDLLRQEPLSGELTVIKANMLFLRNQPESALKLLEAACTRPAGPAPRIALIAAAAIKDRSTAAKLLDRFEQELPNSVDLRLARARFLLEEEKPNLPNVLKLASELGALAKNDQVRLLSGLGELLAQRGLYPEATRLFRQALERSPHDISLMLTLFDLGITTNDSPLRRDMRQGIVKLVGEDGPIAIVAEVSELLSQSPESLIRLPELRRRAELARELRPNWSRVHVLLGDIERRARQSDAALQHYREAVKVGELSDSLLRTMTPLLLERQSQLELLELLAKRSRVTPLPADLAQQLALLRSIYAEDTDKSLAWARSTVATSSKDYRDHLRRASIFIAGRAYPDARQAIEQALSLNNAAPDAWLAMVQFLVLSDRPQEALAARQTAEKSMKPGSDRPAEQALIERVRGLCRDLTGDPAGAEEAFKRSITLEPGDLAAQDAFVQFLLRQERRAEAMSHLARVVQSTESPEVRRWSRRSLAVLKSTGPDAFAERSAALQLIETNLAEAGRLVEDVRLKALILALDPYQQTEAISTLLATTKTIPLNAEQSYLLARMYEAQGDLEKAEASLRDSTRAVSIVDPAHLALLVKIQVKRNQLLSAKETLERLKTIAPKNWLAITEECRVLAAEGKHSQAGKLLLAEYGTQPRAVLSGRIGPFLEQIGCIDSAQQLYSTLANEKGADSHVPLTAFLLRQGKVSEAWKLLATRLKEASPGPSARLIGASARANPPGLLQGEARTSWQAELQNAERWIQLQQQANPDSLDFALALADLADAQGRHDDAIAGYRDILKRAPRTEIAMNNLAVLEALHRRDRTANSLQYINQLISAKGYLPTYLDTRAIVHMVAERYADASQDLETAIRMDPRPIYQFHLAQVYDKQLADRPELASRRDNLLKLALAKGLSKQQLHPCEWAEFDRLMARLPN